MFSIKDNNTTANLDIDVPEKGLTLTDLINKLNLEINKKSRVITSLKLNGESCDLINIDQSILIKKTDSIEVCSDSPVIIAKRSLEDALNQLDDFRDLIDLITSNLIKGDKDTSFKKFTEFLEGFRGVIQLLQTVENIFNLNYSEIRLENKSLKEFSEGLFDILTQIKEAMLNDDLVSLTDLLEYEIKDLFAHDLKKALQILLQILSDDK
ncbi:MAG: hypothetical protein ACD_79C00265G0002 [uncultured bacterium]|nr:MAG: hypothetical protein ACD_79C00265G0002 [uncultured bacterium]